MIQLAVYGKGGIGKSTTVSNISAALAGAGVRVMQIGCDPKADSTSALLGGKKTDTVIDLMRTRGRDLPLEEHGPSGLHGRHLRGGRRSHSRPGLRRPGHHGGAGAFEGKGRYEKFAPDVIIYDVLGDVVCGGFSVPMRAGYAQKVFIVTSGENMAIHAGANIAMAVENFKDRGYAGLGGVILNRRNVKNEDEKVAELVSDIGSELVGSLSRSDTVQDAEELGKTVIEAFPQSAMAGEYRALARSVMAKCGMEVNL
jgi:nitrogenase iron protein NifH